MNFAGFPVSQIIDYNSTVTKIESTNNGIVATPNPITNEGTLSLVADLKHNDNTKNLTLGKNNSVGDGTALHNISIGDNAGQFIVSGDDNINVGYNAGRDNVAGNRNTIIGTDAGIYNKNSNNTYLGYASGFTNINGLANVAIGSESLFNNLTDNNIAIGYRALRSSTNAQQVLAIGSNALSSYAGGDGKNISIGDNASVNLVNGGRNINIGTDNMTNITIADNSNIIGNDNFKTSGSTLPNYITCIGQNNYSTFGNNPNFNHYNNITIGNNCVNYETNGDDKYNLTLIGDALSITDDTQPNTTIIGGNQISLNGVSDARYNVELQGIQAIRSRASVNSGIPSNNFTNLKNLSWNWSSYGYMASGIPTVLFDVNMNQIDWGNQTIQNDPNGKSVLFTLEFVFNGTNAGRSALTVFGGSVSFMVFKNAGQWVFPSLTTVVDLTTNAGNRGYYQFSNSSFGGIYAYQATLGAPEIQVGIIWNSVVGEPLNNSTVSTNVRAVLATNLVDGPLAKFVVNTVDNAYILSHV
jgi:hypothetical protein